MIHVASFEELPNWVILPMSKSPKSILPPSVHPLVRLLHELRDRLSTEKPEVPWWLVQMISMILPVY